MAKVPEKSVTKSSKQILTDLLWNSGMEESDLAELMPEKDHHYKIALGILKEIEEAERKSRPMIPPQPAPSSKDSPTSYPALLGNKLLEEVIKLSRLNKFQKESMGMPP